MTFYPHSKDDEKVQKAFHEYLDAINTHKEKILEENVALKSLKERSISDRVTDFIIILVLGIPTVFVALLVLRCIPVTLAILLILKMMFLDPFIVVTHVGVGYKTVFLIISIIISLFFAIKEATKS